MNIFKKETAELTVLKDIKCDICGDSCKKDKKSGIYEYATFSANWGYMSNKDNEQWEVHMCEACADRFSVWVSTQDGKIRKTHSD